MILYLEDNPANLASVQRLIARRSELRLLSAVDGNIGVKMARIHQPDVILMGMDLPCTKGFGALKILRDDPLTARIPVIALSANGTPSDIERDIRRSLVPDLTKPIKPDDFMASLDGALLHAETTS